MPVNEGEIYRCTDASCGCVVEVRKGAITRKGERPVCCCCGEEMVLAEKVSREVQPEQTQKR